MGIIIVVLWEGLYSVDHTHIVYTQRDIMYSGNSDNPLTPNDVFRRHN